MGLGYADHSLYHWPCPRALATATHLGSFAQGTAAAASGVEWDLAVHIGDIAYGNKTWLLKCIGNHWNNTAQTSFEIYHRLAATCVCGTQALGMRLSGTVSWP
jgi:hypothetical protein